MSISKSPTWQSEAASAAARLTATVLLPTPAFAGKHHQRVFDAGEGVDQRELFPELCDFFFTQRRFSFFFRSFLKSSFFNGL